MKGFDPTAKQDENTWLIDLLEIHKNELLWELNNRINQPELNKLPRFGCVLRFGDKRKVFFIAIPFVNSFDKRLMNSHIAIRSRDISTLEKIGITVDDIAIAATEKIFKSRRSTDLN